jgi:transcriptional regulator with XRE-family HTH domain
MPRPEDKTLGFLYDRYVGNDPERIASYEEARAQSAVATAIYALRTEAGLSQRALAARVGTTASVICQLEDADYEGHSLSMLRRIAAALGRRVEVSFPPAKEPSAPPKDVPTPRKSRKSPAVLSMPCDEAASAAGTKKAPRRAAAKKPS